MQGTAAIAHFLLDHKGGSFEGPALPGYVPDERGGHVVGEVADEFPLSLKVSPGEGQGVHAAYLRKGPALSGAHAGPVVILFEEEQACVGRLFEYSRQRAGAGTDFEDAVASGGSDEIHDAPAYAGICQKVLTKALFGSRSAVVLSGSESLGRIPETFSG